MDTQTHTHTVTVAADYRTLHVCGAARVMPAVWCSVLELAASRVSYAA